MQRRTSKDFKIGDIFLSWVVESCVNPKKYRYLCRCSECGIEKEFIKYNLLRGSYAPCKKCGHKKVKNIPLLKKHWNSELNEAIFDKPESFSLTQSYWFICNSGHNFKSTIKDFSLDRCLGCHENPPNHPSKTQAMEYALQYFKTVSRQVKELNNYMFYIEEFDTVVHLFEVDRYASAKNYFNSELDMLNEIDEVHKWKSNLIENGLDFIQLGVTKNLKENVDIFKGLMIRLVHKV